MHKAMAVTLISRLSIEKGIDDIYLYDLFGGKLENCTVEHTLPTAVAENRATPGKASSACRAFVRRKLPRSAENRKI